MQAMIIKMTKSYKIYKWLPNVVHMFEVYKAVVKKSSDEMDIAEFMSEQGARDYITKRYGDVEISTHNMERSDEKAVEKQEPTARNE
jgi:hypothetical protein